MTTAADLKRFAAPLLTANPDLVRIKRLIAIRPVRHVLRGIYLDGSSSRGVVRPKWFAMILFQPEAFIQFRFAGDIYPKLPGRWNLSDPDAPPFFSAKVEEVALPLLRTLETLEDFYRFAMQDDVFLFGSLNGLHMKQVLVEAARGDFAAADRCSAALLNVPNAWSRQKDLAEEFAVTTEKLCPLIAARDRTGIASMLHAWEEQAVKKLKLEKVWEPSPFPVEAEGS
jgi:hypothetical protein